MSMNFVRAIQFTNDSALERSFSVPIRFSPARRSPSHGPGHDLIRLREQQRRQSRAVDSERHGNGSKFPR